MRPRVIAVCGKGGVGKTTICALIARALSEKKTEKILFIDADPAGGLGMALALKSKRTLEEIRTETIQMIKNGVKAKKELLVSLDYLLMTSLTERNNLAFLSLGRPEELGCYCPVNSLLRDSIELLAKQFDLVVIDAEAGLEQINRKVMTAVEFLMLVSDNSLKGIKIAETIKKLAFKVCRKVQTGLLLNRLQSKNEFTKISRKTKLNLIGWVPEDETIKQFDREGYSFFDLPETPAYLAVIQALKTLGVQ